jgi:hypothetical protein
MSLENIFRKPKFHPDVGEIHPILLKDWNVFEDNVRPLMFSKKHLELENDHDMPLLDRLVVLLQDETLVNSLCKVFNLVFKSKYFELSDNGQIYFFINENKQIISSSNYEEIRDIILNQNILFEPKIYKDPLMASWASKVLKAREKNAANITLEDMITTVSVVSCKHYWDLENYSIYQLKAEFNRITKIKMYDTKSIQLANPYASEIKLEHFAEFLDLYQDPYADIFKSKDKLNNINKAMT